MRTKQISLYKQKQFYHLHTAKIRKTQTKPKQYFRPKSVIKQDELTYIEYDINNYKEMCKEIANRLKQLEKKRKQFEIVFLEKIFGVTFTEEEKQKIMLYI